ncbi:MAG: hypothetical protein LIO67_05625 [Lachnospiraceae bacterium]|nr:hypothetical protein [Lachnospiraceae bacterium]
MAEKLRDGSFKLMVLRELYFAKILPRKLLTDRSMLDWNYRYVCRAMQELERDGYLAYHSFLRRRYCYLTERGFSLLKETDGRYLVNAENYRRHRFYQKQIREQVRDAEVLQKLARYGFRAWPDERPSFADLLRLRGVGMAEEKREAWSYDREGNLKEYDVESLFSEGVYFESAEVRRAAAMLGYLDLLRMGRFCGLLILRDRVYLCYNVMERMMRWSESCERNCVIGIRQLLLKYSAELKIRDVEIEAIVFGRDMNGILPLLWGNTKEVPTEETRKRVAYRSARLFCCENAEFFWKIHYIPLDAAAREISRMQHAEFGGETAGGEETGLYLIDQLELQKLRLLMEQKKAFRLRGFAEYREILERIFGEKLSAFDILPVKD